MLSHGRHPYGTAGTLTTFTCWFGCQTFEFDVRNPPGPASPGTRYCAMGSTVICCSALRIGSYANKLLLACSSTTSRAPLNWPRPRQACTSSSLSREAWHRLHAETCSIGELSSRAGLQLHMAGDDCKHSNEAHGAGYREATLCGAVTDAGQAGAQELVKCSASQAVAVQPEGGSGEGSNSTCQ